MDVFGVIVLALVTALGGGTLRDTLLDRGPVFWIADHDYLLVAVTTSLLTFVAVRNLRVPRQGLLLSDAFGLAIFTGIGTAETLDATGSGSVGVIMGVMTGVAGGMVRDILSAEVPLVLRREIYATASLCGSLVYVVMNDRAFPGVVCLLVSVIATLSIRLAAIRWGLSLPTFASKDNIVGIDTEHRSGPL